MKRNILVAAAVLVGMLNAVAEPVTCVWTGADNAFWTNANNWANGIVPGQFAGKDAMGQTVTMGELDSVAEFGPLPAGAPTTIDMSGLGVKESAVSNIHFSAGAPAITLGTAGTQAQGFRLARFATFVMDPGAGDVTIQGFWCHRQGSYYTLENNSSSTLRFKKYAYYTGGWDGYGKEFHACMRGDGPFVIDGMAQSSRTGGSIYLHLQKSAVQTGETHLTINCDMSGSWWNEIRAEDNARITLGTAGKIIGYLKYYSFTVLANKTLTVDGEGICYDGGERVNGLQVGSPVGVGEYGKLRILCNTASTVLTGGEKTIFNWWSGPDATLEFADGNTREGDIGVVGSVAAAVNGRYRATLKVGKFGGGADPGELGYGNIRIGGWNRVLYAGPGETTTRTLCITNHTIGKNDNGAALTPAFVLEQGGTGDLVFNGRIDANGVTGNATMILANSTAFNATIGSPLEDGASSVLNIRKEGTGRWTLNAANTMTGVITNSAGTLAIGPACSFPAAASIVMAGGELACDAGGAAARTMPAIELAANSTIRLADDCALHFGAIANAGGKRLDIYGPTSARVKFAGLGTDTDAPAWLMVNGSQGYVDGDGYVTEKVTVWQAAQDGLWRTAANWSSGVPAENKVARIEKTGEYTVSVDENAADAGSLFLRHGTLSVAASLGFRAGLFEVEDGARIEVPTGGELVVNSNETAVLAPAVIGANSKLDVSGGIARFGVGKPSNTFAPGERDHGLVLDGGEVEVSGLGTLDVLNTCGIRGTGTVRFSGGSGATFRYGGGSTKEIFVAFTTGDATGLLDVYRASGFRLVPSFTGNGGGKFCFGYNQAGKTRFTMDGSSSDDNLASNPIWYIGVGAIRGESEVVVNGGGLRSGNLGLHIGTDRGLSSVCCATGTVRVAGGLIRGGGVAHIYSGTLNGLVVGNGYTAGTGSCICGNLLVESGSVEAADAPVYFGIGRAIGRGVQNGGTVRFNGSGSWSTYSYPRQSHVFGYGAGTGEYVITNGTFSTTNGAMYIGGCLAADLRTHNTVAGSGGKAAHGAFYARGGVVKVADTDGVIVGADGHGRLEIGPNGVFHTQRLAISNQVEGVLAFELGVGGAGTLVATNMEISAGAKLVIDATGLSAPPARNMVKLATLANAPSGEFDMANVTFLHTPALEKFFRAATIEYSLEGRPGLWLLGSPCGCTIIIR